MFTHIKVTPQNTHLINFVTVLLEESFPQEERRETNLFWEIAFSFPLVTCCVVAKQSLPIAFYYIWDFKDIAYLEFVAVVKEYRSQGLFSLFLKEILQEFKKPLICEAERVETELAQRRLALYLRLGFTIVSDTYMQPPFRKSDAPQPMYLLAHLNQYKLPSTEEVINLLYTEVYHSTHKKL